MNKYSHVTTTTIKIQNCSNPLKVSLCSQPFSLPSAPGNLFSLFIILLFPEYHKNERAYTPLCSASFTHITSVRIAHVVMYTDILFLFIAAQYSTVWTYNTLLFIRSLRYHSGCFQRFIIMITKAQVF